MIRHAGNTDALTSSDRQVIEDLRQNLRTRTKEHGGTKSILEAIGDPKLREARLYYEPLTKFLSGHDKQIGMKGQRKIPFRKTTNGYTLNTSTGYTPDIGLLNVMMPPSQKHFNTPVGHRQAVTSYSVKQPRSGAKHYTIFPKMPSLQNFGSKSEMPVSDHIKAKSSLDAAPEQINYSLSPSSVNKNNTEIERKTGFSLPSISLQMQQELLENPSANFTKSPTKHPANLDHENQMKRKIYTQPMESTAAKRTTRATRPRVVRPQPVTRTTAGYSPGTKLTATGKSHLIGPMNKMDMIVEYSRLLQDKVINYEQYTKKLSKLSLHKIDLGNSGLRQYHIVRDGSTGMKPRLARVDIHPSRKTQQGQEDVKNKSRNTTKANISLGWTEILRRDAAKTTEGRLNQQRFSTMAQSRNLVGSAIEIPSATPHEASSPYKSGNFRMSRISIGEEIPESRFEHFNTGYDVGNDEYLTYDDVIRMQGTDIDRYRHAHRPRNADKYNYHWNHLPPSNHMMYSSATGNRSHTQEVANNINPPDELYNGFAGRLLQNSREVKRRLNFSYPSYNVMLDGTNPVSSAEKNPAASSQEQDGKSAEDPDYLAITIDQPTDDTTKVTSSDGPALTSSLSVHDVTIPTEVKVITGVIQPKNTTPQKKGVDIKLNNAGSTPFKGSLEGLNITPVSITSSEAVNPNPQVNKTPYFVSQDDFVATGTDGVMQTHLNTIYRSINKAKGTGTKKEVENGPAAQPGKNSPPNVLITKMTKKNEPEGEINKIITENAKLLQPSKRFPPPNTPPPKTVSFPSQPPENIPVSQTLAAPSKNLTVTSQVPVTSSSTTSQLPSMTKISISDSPPPTAFLLQTREDEVTSAESDDDINDLNDVTNVNDVIDVNITAIPVE